MIICFECSPEMKRLMDDFVTSGGYEDYGQVISSALENLALIKQALSKSGSLVLEDGALQPNIGDTYDRRSRKPLNTPIENKGHSAQVPEIFKLTRLDTVPATIADLPPVDQKSHGEAPANQWLFSMFNKLLPAKANCRALWHLLLTSGSGVPVGDSVATICDAARHLGDYLQKLDNRLGLSRDDALATAFPTTKKGDEKSVQRYANQFLVSVGKDGQISGLLYELRFIACTSDRNPRLLLTRPGIEFARLANPVLDTDMPTQKEKFTTEEVLFFLAHIGRFVQPEYSAYRQLLGYIARGIDTPDLMDEEIRKSFSDTDRQEFSSAYLSSQRSGAISRMVDLNLVNRIRKGIRVSYQVTSFGESLTQDLSIKVL